MSESILPTAEEIRDGARRFGVRLLHDNAWYVRDEACGCAAGVLAIIRNPELANRAHLYLDELNSELGHATVSGLSDGFEGWTRERWPSKLQDEYDRAFDVGREVRWAEWPELKAWDAEDEGDVQH